MKTLPICQLGCAVLRQRSARVGVPLSAARQTLIDRMIATMKKAKGVGIAAPQVGVGLRLFIVAPEPSARYPKAPRLAPLAMMNPRMIRHSSRLSLDWEGCLSIPGIRAKVPRYASVEIAFTDRGGTPRRARLTGFVARIFQHEFDHINGRVFLDRVRDPQTFMTEAEYRKLW